MILDPEIIKNLTLYGVALAGAFLVALWVALIIWAARDIKKRSRDALARILAVIIVILLFLPGALIYLLLRPQKTLEEEFQTTLEEEALLHAIEETPVCPGCNRKVNADWIVCPDCHTRIRKTCQRCQKLMSLSWSVCPYCATPAPGMTQDNLSLDEALRRIPADDE